MGGSPGSVHVALCYYFTTNHLCVFGLRKMIDPEVMLMLWVMYVYLQFIQSLYTARHVVNKKMLHKLAKLQSTFFYDLT